MRIFSKKKKIHVRDELSDEVTEDTFPQKLSRKNTKKKNHVLEMSGKNEWPEQ